MDEEPPIGPDWDGIWLALNELGASLAPFIGMREPPPWTVTLCSAMDAAMFVVEDECRKSETVEEPSDG